MKAGFTKGPWRESYSGGGTTEIIAADGLVVAAVWDMASAPVISAAPDLAEALAMALRQNQHDMIMTGEECRICEAALKKAGVEL